MTTDMDDKPRAIANISRPRFRPYVQVLTERSRPEPIFIVAATGVDFWLRLDIPANVLVLSPRQRKRELGRMIRDHYANRRGSAVPFGKIIGYVFRSLPHRAVRYSILGLEEGAVAVTTHHVELTMRLH